MFELKGIKYYTAEEFYEKLHECINSVYEKYKFIKYEDSTIDARSCAGDVFIEFLEFIKDNKFLNNDFFDTIGHEYYYYEVYGPINKGAQHEN